MSPSPEPTGPRLRPRSVAGLEEHADAIDVRAWPPTRHPATTDPAVDPPDTVVLGRWVPYPAPAIESVARRPDGPITGPVVPNSIVDGGGLHDLRVSRRERRYPPPPPARPRHRGWVLSSPVIACGGILAVLLAGDIGGIPIVATTALVATVVCGAILVAAQLVQEIGRARTRRASGVASAFEVRH